MDTLTPERWQEVKAVLDEIVDLPLVDRDQRLESACGGDAELRREVEAFLSFEDSLDGFIERPAAPPDTDATGPLELSSGAALMHDRKIGPYRAIRLIGRGGMGEVYLAEREDGFRQRVALKLIKDSFFAVYDSEKVSRFANERQILARLEHPYIARLLDGGTSDDGLPYFAMEYVDGQPIDRYADAACLSTRERLELFVKVCEAIGFAHRGLVIHRDLKPGNILVDARGTPKLLDFGIAKLLGSDLAPQTTMPGARALTLRYASPEHFLGEPITTASDIYSLGVLLYRLLTGHFPGGLEGASFAEIVQTVSTEDPQRPSTVVTRTEDLPTGPLTPDAVSRTRDGDPQRLRRSLAGDVDAIVLKALQKDPRRRYATAEQLADDIRRHLRGLPVEAREPTFLYRAGKLVRRHRWLAAMVVFVAALAAGFTLALVRERDNAEEQRRVAERQRDETEQVMELLMGVLTAADPDVDLTARELLEQGRRKLSEQESPPEVRLQVLRKLAHIYRKLGDYEVAAGILREEIDLRRETFGETADLADSLNRLAAVYVAANDHRRVGEIYQEALAVSERLGLERADQVSTLFNYATTLLTRGRYREAEELYRETLELRLNAAPDEDADEQRKNIARSQRGLGVALRRQGRLDEAEPFLREALAARVEIYGEGDRRVTPLLSSLGRLAQDRGDYGEAERLFTEALEIRQERLGEAHDWTALSRADLGGLFLETGDLAKARTFLVQALAVLSTGPRNENLATTESLFGELLTREGRFAEAEDYLRRSRETLQGICGPDAVPTRDAERRLAELLAARGARR